MIIVIDQSVSRAPRQGSLSCCPKVVCSRRRAEGPGRRGRGDPGADGRQAQRPLRAVQAINQARALVLTAPDDLRTRFARHTAASLVSGLASLRPRPGDVVGYATRIALRELGRRAGFLDGQLERPDELIAPLVAAVPPACSPCTVSAPTPPPCSWSPPGTTRSGCAARRLGAPVRGRPDTGIVGESHPLPPQSRRRPPGQPRPMADRAHPDERPSADSHLRRAAHQGRPAGERDHPLPEALRRPRGLPPPPRSRLTLTLRGRPDPQIGCRTRAGLLQKLKSQHSYLSTGAGVQR